MSTFDWTHFGLQTTMYEQRMYICCIIYLDVSTIEFNHSWKFVRIYRVPILKAGAPPPHFQKS